MVGGGGGKEEEEKRRDLSLSSGSGRVVSERQREGAYLSLLELPSARNNNQLHAVYLRRDRTTAVYLYFRAVMVQRSLILVRKLRERRLRLQDVFFTAVFKRVFFVLSLFSDRSARQEEEEELPVFSAS